MAEGSSKAFFRAEEVVDMLSDEENEDSDDFEHDIGETFFPGSDEDIGLYEETIENSDSDSEHPDNHYENLEDEPDSRFVCKIHSRDKHKNKRNIRIYISVMNYNQNRLN